MADTKEKLIKLDREWGEATKPEQLKGLLTEKFISLDEDGIANRQQLMDALAKSTPPDEPYVAGGYTVQMIDDKVAVMVHSAGSGRGQTLEHARLAQTRRQVEGGRHCEY